MVYYRKYRPQLISELDLSSVREKLTAILSSNNIPHAFLFAGPKGLGKTSSARILAKAINCERIAYRSEGSSFKDKKLNAKPYTLDAPSIEPCNQCSACISITNGSNVDVLEIDAASNRGIDEIRDLRDRIKFLPSMLKKKVYIIDEVHMLTTEAFNALLKTLEEPPSHVLFILCTTETGKLPATIRSRVFLLQFEKPTPGEILRSLQRVVKGEKLDIEKGVLEKIGELSDGAFRDGAKLLEELSLQSNGKKITADLLETLYKTGSTDTAVEKLLTFTLAKNVNSALLIIDQLANTNADFKQVIEKMAGILHLKLLTQAAKKTDEISSTQKILELLDKAYKELRGAVLPQLPLELAVIEYSLENNTEKSVQNEVRPQLASEKFHIEENKLKSSFSLNDISGSDILKSLIHSVNVENKILAGLLRGCRVEELNGSAIKIKAPSTFHLGKLTEPKNKIILEEKLQEILGKAVAIVIKS